MTTLNGIDVSAVGQGTFNWTPYAGKVQFAFAKVSEDTTYADPMAKRNIAQMRSLGLVAGAYHFLHAGQSGAEQAEKFLSHAHAAGLSPGDLIAIDAEDAGLDGLPVAHLAAAAGEFAAEVRRHFPSLWPVLYTELSLAPAFASLGQCPLWLANPSRVHTGKIGPWAGVSLEQTGQRGVDTDVFYGDLAQLKKLAIPK